MPIEQRHDCETGETLEISLPNPTVAARKAALLDAIRAERWAREEGGTTVNGLPIKTDEASRGKIAGAVQLMDKDPTVTSIDFEAQPGTWVALNKAQMEAIGVAAGRHVQACFTHSKALMALVNGANTHGALDPIDIGAGWP